MRWEPPLSCFPRGAVPLRAPLSHICDSFVVCGAASAVCIARGKDAGGPVGPGVICCFFREFIGLVALQVIGRTLRSPFFWKNPHHETPAAPPFAT